MLDRFRHDRPMISGVCAWMADRSGFPILAVRAGAVLLLVCHFALALLLYLAGAIALRRAATRPDRQDGPFGRFAAIDRRVARMEEEAWRRQTWRW